MMDQKLHLLWSPNWGNRATELDLPEGVSLRQLMREDYDNWEALMISSGFFADPVVEARQLFDVSWAASIWLGLFDKRTGALVAADFEQPSSHLLYPNAVELFYISVLPTYRGKKLAKHLTEAHLLRAQKNRLSNVFVETDDFRLASICNCLNLGFRPCLYVPEMVGRWKAVFDQIGRPFEPDAWPRHGEAYVPHRGERT